MFTTPCFIRKNTPELQRSLRKLGYKKSDYFDFKRGNCISTGSSSNVYCIITKEMFDDTNPHTTWGIKNRVDCGTNEELFLAIAALRDDTDENQWFVYQDYWFICDVSDIEHERELSKESMQAAYFHCSHKATVNELIEHFKSEDYD